MLLRVRTKREVITSDAQSSEATLPSHAHVFAADSLLCFRLGDRRACARFLGSAVGKNSSGGAGSMIPGHTPKTKHLPSLSEAPSGLCVLRVSVHLHSV